MGVGDARKVMNWIQTDVNVTWTPARRTLISEGGLVLEAQPLLLCQDWTGDICPNKRYSFSRPLVSVRWSKGQEDGGNDCCSQETFHDILSWWEWEVLNDRACLFIYIPRLCEGPRFNSWYHQLKCGQSWAKRTGGLTLCGVTLYVEWKAVAQSISPWKLSNSVIVTSLHLSLLLWLPVLFVRVWKRARCCLM